MIRKLSHQEIIERQKGIIHQSRLPLTAVLNNIRSLYNVGSIFRTADGVGIEKLWICGITGHPPNGQISKTALGAEESVPWEYQENVNIVIDHLKAQGYHIVLLEQTKESCPHDQFRPEKPVCLVIGNEISGVNESIVDVSDAAVEIEMSGMKNSLNVSVAFGIVAYSLRSAFKQSLN